MHGLLLFCSHNAWSLGGVATNTTNDRLNLLQMHFDLGTDRYVRKGLCGQNRSLPLQNQHKVLHPRLPTLRLAHKLQVRKGEMQIAINTLYMWYQIFSFSVLPSLL